MPNLYSTVKMLHFKSKLDDIANKHISSPIHIRLKPTNVCNHSCYYCCYRNDNLYLSELMQKKDMISRDKMIEIIDDLVAMGVKAVTLSGGGDPLVYPHINETIEGLLNVGIKLATLTNGSMLKNKTAELLAKGASWVRISMDAADPELYAKTRGVSQEEFGKVCDNIKNFAAIKRKECELGINFIVNENNHGDVYRFLELAKNLGANHVKFSECVVSTKGEENNCYQHPFFNFVKEQITKAKGTLADEHFTIIDKFHDFDDKYEKPYNRCPFIQFLTVIAADCNVYTCQDKAYTTSGKLGSLKDNSFKEMWYSTETQERLLHFSPLLECNHHCVQHGKNVILLDYLETNKDHLEFV